MFYFILFGERRRGGGVDWRVWVWRGEEAKWIMEGWMDGV